MQYHDLLVRSPQSVVDIGCNPVAQPEIEVYFVDSHCYLPQYFLLSTDLLESVVEEEVRFLEPGV